MKSTGAGYADPGPGWEKRSCRLTENTMPANLAKHEEGLLVARLGDDYEEYRCRLC